MRRWTTSVICFLGVLGSATTGRAAPLAERAVSTATMFDRMSFSSGGIVVGKSVKFLIDNRKTAQPEIYYMNAQFKDSNGRTPDSARYHYFFGKAVLPNFTDTLEAFNNTTYSVQQKRFYAGTIQIYKVGDAAQTLYGAQFYPEDVASEGTIVKVLEIVKRTFTIPSAKLAFVATGPQQKTATVGPQIVALGFQNSTIDSILGSLKFIPMNQGDAWGYLRIYPNSDDLTPMDIAVFNELPLDLAVVAGVITRAFQDASAHVNLKSKERGTPNMFLRGAGPTHPDLARWKNKPVRLSVKADGFTITATTAAVVKNKYKARINKPWVPLLYEAETRLLSYGEMCATSPGNCLKLAKRYGSKVAGLGFLTSRTVLGRASDATSMSKTVGYNIVPEGFGVPIQFYKDFVAFAPNSVLRTKLKDLIVAEQAGTLSNAQRITKLKAVQEQFYKSQFPPDLLAKITARLAVVLPGVKKIKVRSSGNAEDLAGFNGAGLYDSLGANLTKEDNPDGSCAIKQEAGDLETKLEMTPKTLACALKGVYASVWNKRAIEERSFARLDHATAGMGSSIVPKYDNESEIAANAVVVTRVIGSDGVYGYTFSTQKGNNLVTNPDPGTLSEAVIAAFTDLVSVPTFVVTRYAMPTAGGPRMTSTVLTKAQMTTMLKIARQVETAYCGAKPGFYSGDCRYVSLDPMKPASLDMEFKILENGHFVCKQAREFGGR